MRRIFSFLSGTICFHRFLDGFWGRQAREKIKNFSKMKFSEKYQQLK